MGSAVFLRIFGRGKVQMQAIEELQQLPKTNPFRDRILELVANMVAILEVRQQEQQGLESEEREFLMQLSTVYTQRLQEAEQRGIAIAQQRLIRNLLSKGMTIEEIAELTELSPEKVTQLINQDEQ
jgi:predicted transposase/invertase (TIGR01784 family)